MDVALMYHYVRNPKEFLGSVPLSKEEFKKQLEQLAKKYDIVSPDDLNKPSTKNRCVITFDDGTKDQYENAYAVLKEMGLPGYFTVMSGPLLENHIPNFHLVHNLLSNFDDEVIWKELADNFNLPDLSNADSIYFYEKDQTRRYIKYLLNFVWSAKQSEGYLLEKVSSSYKNIDKFINDFYINADEFKEMHKAGMTIGIHAHKHIGFNGNGKEFFDQEIAPCLNYIRDDLGIVPKWYTPAFGGGEHKDTMHKELEPILRANNIKGAFTTIEGANTELDTYWFNRYDCNRFEQVLKLV